MIKFILAEIHHKHSFLELLMNDQRNHDIEQNH